MGPIDVTRVRAMVADSLAIKQKMLADDAPVAEVAEVVTRAFRAGDKGMRAGSGGPAADSQHIAAEFGSRLRAR